MKAIKTTVTLSAIATLALASSACQQGATNKMETASANAIESTNTTDVPVVANASNAMAAPGPTIPTAYQGEWANISVNCGNQAHSFRYSITPTTVRDGFNYLYTVTNVENRGSGIVVTATRPSAMAGARDPVETFNFAVSSDGNGLTNTTRTGQDLRHVRCPA